jgi:hypothetical protein
MPRRGFARRWDVDTFAQRKVTMSRIKAGALALLLASVVTAPHAQEPQGPREGIKVHGHWVIDVKNPDGTLATHYEFENALTNNGPLVLSSVLSGNYVIRSWYVYLEDGTGPSPCPAPNHGCILADTRGADTASPGLAKNLVVNPGAADFTLRMGGSIRPPQAGRISVVSTRASYVCAPNTYCTDFGNLLSVTSAQLPQAVDVVAGQLVEVLVILSFS